MSQVFREIYIGAVAQLGARLLGVEKVGGSNPPSSTTITETNPSGETYI